MGLYTANSVWPSLAFVMPSSADDSEVTMELRAETKIVKHSVGNTSTEIEIELPYLSLKDDVICQYQEGALIPLIRPVLPSEQIKSSTKLTKSYLKQTSTLEMFQSVCPDLLEPPKGTGEAPVPKAKAKAKQSKGRGGGMMLEHMTKPPLLLAKAKAKAAAKK